MDVVRHSELRQACAQPMARALLTGPPAPEVWTCNDNGLLCLHAENVARNACCKQTPCLVLPWPYSLVSAGEYVQLHTQLVDQPGGHLAKTEPRISGFAGALTTPNWAFGEINRRTMYGIQVIGSLEGRIV